MSTTVDKEKQTIAIRPYVEGLVDEMGLENYDMVVFDDIIHKEDLACIARNGVFRYLNGLDEYAQDVQAMKDKEEKAARIKNIREHVARLEAMMGDRIVDPEDSDFWNKIELLRPTNADFWGKFFIEVGNKPVFLDPDDPNDFIIIRAIEHGGFDLVAKSFEDARSQPKRKKWYLDKEIRTKKTQTEVKKLRNKALGLLDELYASDRARFMYVCKLADAVSVQYKLSTPLDVMYDNMDGYINGEGAEKSVKRASRTFVNAAELDPEELKIKAVIKDANMYKFIGALPDGIIYYLEERIPLGRTTADVFTFLQDPTNEDVFMKVLDKVENEWNK